MTCHPAAKPKGKKANFSDSSRLYPLYSLGTKVCSLEKKNMYKYRYKGYETLIATLVCAC